MLFLVVSAAIASAIEVPTDAEVLVTDAGSRIVGVGRVVAGTTFDLVLVDGFAGPAVVTWLTPDGGVRTTEVVVLGGVVWVDDADLTSLLPEAFVEVRVRLAKELGDAWPIAVGQDPPDAGRSPEPSAANEPPELAGPTTSPEVPHPRDDAPGDAGAGGAGAGAGAGGAGAGEGGPGDGGPGDAGPGDGGPPETAPGPSESGAGGRP